MENYRFTGLTRRADEISQQLKEEGLMGCDLEVIGAIIFTKFKGQDKKMSKLLEDSSKVLKEAQELLESLKRKV